MWLTVFLFGLCAGSFLNVLIYRIPRNLGFIKGGSFCPKCGKKIFWHDNIPLLSFIVLGGRCRFCHSPISWRYPIVELTTGVLFVLGSASYLNFLDWGLTLVLFSGLLVIFFIDLEHQIIPDEVLIPLTVLLLISKTLNSLFIIHNSFLSFLIPAIGAFTFLFLIYIVTKGRGMGFGDVKFAFLMGLVLSWPKIVIAFYFAFLTGALIGVILILGKKAKFGQKVAFGPFLVFSTLVAFLWGERILKLVTGFLF